MVRFNRNCKNIVEIIFLEIYENGKTARFDFSEQARQLPKDQMKMRILPMHGSLPASEQVFEFMIVYL